MRYTFTILLLVGYLTLPAQDHIGKWKPVTVTLLFKDKSVPAHVIELTNNDSVRKLITKAFGDKPSDADMLLRDSLIVAIESASLTIKADSAFMMVNKGVIVKNDPNGWDSGPVIQGKWRKNGNILLLFAKGNDAEFEIWFKIITTSKNNLVLREVRYGALETGNTEIRFTRME